MIQNYYTCRILLSLTIVVHPSIVTNLSDIKSISHYRIRLLLYILSLTIDLCLTTIVYNTLITSLLNAHTV
jgi:hypothetical protein